jgi:hypothetical protein
MFRSMMTLAAVLAAGASTVGATERDDDPVPLVIAAGTPLQIALDRRVTVTRVGQSVTGTLVEPAYAYDRVVLPAGTPVRGHRGRAR